MRIVLIGQAAFAEKVLEKLIERKEDVVGVYCPPDTPGRPNPIKEIAAKEGIPVFQPKRIKAPEAVEEYKKLKPDLNILAFVTEIIPDEVLQYPTHGSIQYHPSLLPKHRGRSAINWAIINGETETGLSIFWVDAGIDTGPVLLQKKTEILPDDTTGGLYFNKLFPLGIDAMMESLDLVKAGKAPKIEQDESEATYEPPCEDQIAGIDWNKPAKEVYDLIRGCDPQPGAYTSFKGEKLRLYDASFSAETASGEPGSVCDITDSDVAVSANGGVIRFKRVRGGGGKMAAPEFAAQVKLAKGDVLGS